MSPRPTECDVVIIGAGAAGACVAYTLASRGIETVVLEKGDWLGDRTYDDDELYYYILRLGWPAIDKEFSKIDVRDGVAPVSHRMGQSYGVVGGGTVYYAGVSERFRSEDFQKETIYGAPAGTSVADWPQGFEGEIEPYYAMAERLIGVSGRSPHGMRPLPGHKLSELLVAGAQRLGWPTYPIPLALHSTYNPQTGLSWCISSGLCSGYPCAWNAKSSVDATLLAKVRHFPNLHVETGVAVESIETDKNGRCRGVVAIDRLTKDSNRFRIEAKVVVLAASGILSPLLLLQSAGKGAPNGVANHNGLVGRNLMFHIEGQKGGMFPENEFRRDNFYNLKKIMTEHFYRPDDTSSFINHSTIQAGSKSGPIQFVRTKRPRGWGTDYLKSVARDYMCYHELQAMVEDLPQHDNCVTTHPKERDVDGMPVAFIHHRYHAMDQAALALTFKRMAQWLESAGATNITPDPPPTTPVGYHPMGSIRMGENSDTSVVDRNCRAHTSPNLYVADGSIFPTGAGVNPTLTIQANAFRIADRILEANSRGEL